jgi:SAM-dependent methyltransferase
VSAYGSDLAHIHASGYTSLAESAAPVIVSLLGEPDGLVIDLGCGNGVTTRALVEAGHDVLGIDPSAAMLAIARRTAPGARFRQASALDTGLPACRAVIAVGEVLNYTERSLDPFFRRVRDALRPGGHFVLDLAGPGRVAGGDPVRHWHEGEGWAILVETEEDAERGLLTRRMTTFRRAGGSWRRREEVHRQRLHRPPDVAIRLRALGFRVRIRRGYAGERFAPGHFAVMARRPNHTRVDRV